MGTDGFPQKVLWVGQGEEVGHFSFLETGEVRKKRVQLGC